MNWIPGFSWWWQLGVPAKASSVLAFWKSVELIWQGGKAGWSYWSWKRDRHLRESYPSLYKRLGRGQRWMLRDRADFPRSHLFAHLLQDEIDSRKMLRMDFELEIPAWEKKEVSSSQIGEWMSERNSELIGMVETLGNISESMGGLLTITSELGESQSDPEEVAHIAKRTGEVYEKAIRMGIESQKVTTEDQYQDVVDAYADGVYAVINTIEELSSVSRDIPGDIMDKYSSQGGLPWSIIPSRAYMRFSSLMDRMGLWDLDGKVELEKTVEMPAEPIDKILQERKKVGI